MRRLLPISLVLALGLAVAPVWAQKVEVYKSTVGNLPTTCEPGQPYMVTDGNSSSDCVTGSGTTEVICACNADGSTYASIGVFTPSADPGVDHSSLAGGAHITESGGSIALDAEVVKHSEPFYIEIPVTDEDLPSIFRAHVALTITEIWCETDAGTVGLDITIDDGTPLAVNGSDISCAVSTGTADSTFSNSAAMADGDRLDINIGTVATATRLSVSIEYTVDDV